MAEQASKVSGIVQIDGVPAKRTVRAFGYSATSHNIDGTPISLSKSLGHATSDPDTGEYTIDLLGGYDQRIFVVAFDDYGADFKPDLAVTVGDRVHPTTPNGHVWECTGSGTLPSEEPTWVIDTETAQLYGTASMIARPFYRPMVHGPVAPEVIASPAPELPTVIGEPFGGGFYAGEIIDGGKAYKLIVSDIEADSGGLLWKTENTDSPGTSSETDGLGNTQAMDDGKHPAADHCLNWRGGGFDDWYMPTLLENEEMYRNLSPTHPETPPLFMTGGGQAFSSSYYFCSNQYNAVYAYRFRMSDGREDYGSKSGSYQRVRPIRRVEFTPPPTT